MLMGLAQAADELILSEQEQIAGAREKRARG